MSPKNVITVNDYLESICTKLPDGWSMRIELENGWAGVVLIRPDSTSVDLEEQVEAALHLIHCELQAAMNDKEELCP